MKELNIRLADDIADLISNHAKQLGLTAEELTKFIVGSWAQRLKPPVMPVLDLGGMFSRAQQSQFPGLSDKEKIMFERITTYIVKKQLKAGDFKCENCTLPLDEQAFIDGKCSECGQPLLGEEQQGEKPEKL